MLQMFKKKKKEKLPARIRGNTCLNCNINLEGEENFCPTCGQRNNLNPLSFNLVLNELFDDMFSYDSRLWHTIIPLVLKPGKVAYQFILGKRKNLVNPFRTYFTVSLIFFLVYGLLNTIEQYNGDGSKNSFFNFDNSNNDDLTDAERDSIINLAFDEGKKNATVAIDSILKAQNIDLDSTKNVAVNIDSVQSKLQNQNKLGKKLKAFYNYYEKNKEHTANQALDSLGYKNTFWNQFYYDKAQNVKDMMDDKGEGISNKIFSGLSIAIFLLLPIFALFLKLLYIRRKYTYMEHLVFVFYTQSVFFLFMLLFLIVYSFSNGKEELITIAMLLFTIYLYLAMKKFYKQGWFKTFFKFLLANFSFLIISTIGFSLLAVISFIFY